MPQGPADPRDLLGAPLERARTLPGRVVRRSGAPRASSWTRSSAASGSASAAPTTWPRPGSYLVATAGGLPVLIVRDDAGKLRAFLNVCRHRGSRSADGCGHARALSCPYHAWVYRLDGSLARAGGVGTPDGFDPADYGLRAVARHDVRPLGHRQRRPVGAAPSTPARSPSALDPYRLDELELGERTRYERHFNWKVLLENYCENYHTPFIHSQLPRRLRVPDRVRRPIVFAWDRPLRRATLGAGAARSPPGNARLGGVADVAAADSFNNGTYLALFPNTADVVLRRVRRHVPAQPTGPATTVVEREYFWHPSVPPERRAADLAATRGGRRPGPRDLRGAAGHVRRRAVGRRRAVDDARVGRRPRPSAPPRALLAGDRLGKRRWRRPTRTRFAVEARRQQIVDAMHKVVLERGLHDTRFADVAAQLGISSGLIHYHFATKEELIEAMLREKAADGRRRTRRSRWPRCPRPSSGSPGCSTRTTSRRAP